LQGQQNFTYGKVNHVAAEEAQQSQDVVLGMFLVNSHPATILFDPGTSHSLISSKFVAKLSLPITNMKYTMLVSSPGGEMKTKHIGDVSGAIRVSRATVQSRDESQRMSVQRKNQSPNPFLQNNARHS
jgi:hypothetical protein